ncbi:hypothetical protein DIS24_g10995 [Lasiodiplodia hormozganensis]|uniref:Uncharacterized protein n=1 Tax=Lasiodiplodia hormozganensis TaxID=869390 RepID=A0AA40C518_9PEZI|nr:hypothetical protein DIS24_g10995 [Lasiodiplodia hormozganensis]
MLLTFDPLSFQLQAHPTVCGPHAVAASLLKTIITTTKTSILMAVTGESVWLNVQVGHLYDEGVRLGLLEPSPADPCEVLSPDSHPHIWALLTNTLHTLGLSDAQRVRAHWGVNTEGEPCVKLLYPPYLTEKMAGVVGPENEDGGNVDKEKENAEKTVKDCDGIDTVAETNRLVKLMKGDRKFFGLAKPVVPELRWTSDAPTSHITNLNTFLDRVKHFQPQTSIPTGMLGLPRTDRAMAIHRAGEFLENLRKIKPMALEDLAATGENCEALKKYSGLTKEVEEVNTRTHNADSSQGPSPLSTSVPVEQFSRQDPEHKRNNSDSSAFGHGTLLQPVTLRPSISTDQQRRHYESAANQIPVSFVNTPQRAVILTAKRS